MRRMDYVSRVTVRTDDVYGRPGDPPLYLLEVLCRSTNGDERRIVCNLVHPWATSDAIDEVLRLFRVVKSLGRYVHVEPDCSALVRKYFELADSRCCPRCPRNQLLAAVLETASREPPRLLDLTALAVLGATGSRTEARRLLDHVPGLRWMSFAFDRSAFPRSRNRCTGAHPLTEYLRWVSADSVEYERWMHRNLFVKQWIAADSYLGRPYRTRPRALRLA